MADRALQILAPRYKSWKDDGTVNSGGFIYFYEAGTTTLKDTYQDAEATVANANPVELNSRGEAAIYGRGTYKIIEKDSDEVQIGDAMDGVLFLDVTDDILALLNDATTAQMRSTLGLGTAATKNAGTSAGEVLLLAVSGTLPALDASNLTNVAQGQGPLPYGYKKGLTLSVGTNTTTFGISAGACRSSGNVANMALTSAYTKTMASWAVGTAAGSLDAGSVATSTWYHVYAIYNATTGVTDILTSLSATDPDPPEGYATFRRIGALLTDGTPYITTFVQYGDEFLWKDPPLDVDLDGTLGATASLHALSTPLGVQVRAILNMAGTHASTVTAIYASSPDVTDEAPDYNANSLVGQINTASTTAATATAGHVVIRTDTSSQIRLRASNASTYCSVTTLGWIENF
ncbi:MAG: hypothetical protein C4542_08195 [Dehalococcoidia bacterium]|nr:MAG: hypothetical protein C4542_08195 [Dehalococcoidia bacterium]